MPIAHQGTPSTVLSVCTRLDTFYHQLADDDADGILLAGRLLYNVSGLSDFSPKPVQNVTQMTQLAIPHGGALRYSFRQDCVPLNHFDAISNRTDGNRGAGSILSRQIELVQSTFQGGCTQQHQQSGTKGEMGVFYCQEQLP